MTSASCKTFLASSLLSVCISVFDQQATINYSSSGSINYALRFPTRCAGDIAHAWLMWSFLWWIDINLSKTFSGFCLWLIIKFDDISIYLFVDLFVYFPFFFFFIIKLKVMNESCDKVFIGEYLSAFSRGSKNGNI